MSFLKQVLELLESKLCSFFKIKYITIFFSKIEAMFYEDKIRINGKKLAKKSALVSILSFLLFIKHSKKE